MPSSFSDSMEHNGYLYMKGKQQTNQFMLFTLVSVRKIPSVSLAIGEIRGKQIRKVTKAEPNPCSEETNRGLHVNRDGNLDTSNRTGITEIRSSYPLSYPLR